ncbi:MAG: hypothetical protein ACFB0B_02795 [Thermonemataceae bacterium]
MKIITLIFIVLVVSLSVQAQENAAPAESKNTTRIEPKNNIKLSNTTLSLNSIGTHYERLLTPRQSLSIGYDYSYSFHDAWRLLPPSHSHTHQTHLQYRYYLKFDKKNYLSGLYAGAVLLWQHSHKNYGGEHLFGRSTALGLSVGYQKRFLKRFTAELNLDFTQHLSTYSRSLILTYNQPQSLINSNVIENKTTRQGFFLDNAAIRIGYTF